VLIWLSLGLARRRLAEMRSTTHDVADRHP
jgi:hypothetical protein